MRSDIDNIRFAFETRVDVIAWLRGTLITADVGTKLKSRLTDVVQLTPTADTLQLDISTCESPSCDRVADQSNNAVFELVWYTVNVYC